MADPVVVAAAIGAIPASIAAVAALKVNRKVSTNGSKKNIGVLVEGNVEQLMRLSTSVERHHADETIHGCHHNHGVCDTCGTILE